MRKTAFILALALFSIPLFSQQKEAAEALVAEGVALHDEGQYEEAIEKYNQALKLDRDNLLALSEKALTLLASKRLAETTELCDQAFATYEDSTDLLSLFVTCGNAYDEQKETDKALALYDRGIAQFSGFYLLYYNKGIALAKAGDADGAIAAFEEAVKHNPAHASSHDALGRFLNLQQKKIPALLALSRLLILEPTSKRGQEDLNTLRNLLNTTVRKDGNNLSVTVNVPDDDDETPKENDFTSADIFLSVIATLDYEDGLKNQTEAEQLVRKLSSLFSLLAETSDENFGFYWEYYVPYFAELDSKEFTETFVHLILLSSGSEEVKNWLNTHEQAIDEFYNWSQNFQWKTF